MPTRVRSYSKINLGLAVGPGRADGFHALLTCYQTIEAHDLVTVSVRPWPGTEITLTADHPGVPRTETGDAEKNTATRLVAKALDALGITARVQIDIQKRLPVQGGLGAGSANAAAALIAFEKEAERAFGISGLEQGERMALAAEVGSDVPLFLVGGTSLGTNRGEQVSELPDLPEMPCVLAIPSVGVSTKQAFADLDARMQLPTSHSPLPAPLQDSHSSDRLIRLSHALSLAFANGRSLTEPGLSGIASQTGDQVENPLLTLVRTGIENDFEEVAFLQHPHLRDIKHDLAGRGSEAAVYAALSGSGSALFGLYETQQHALAAQQRVQASGTRAIVTSTINRERYWHTMFAE